MSELFKLNASLWKSSKPRRFLVGWLAWLFFLPLFGTSCLVKTTVTVPVSPRILAAREADLDQLLGIIKNAGDRIAVLASTEMRVTFTSGKVESGRLQAYRSAPGYLFMKRPDSFLLKIQNPLTKTAVLELHSNADDFGIWYPRENKFFVGKNSARTFALDDIPAFTARPIHIYEAIMPWRVPLDDPSIKVALEEEQDSHDKYYVLSFYQDQGSQRLVPLRRVWIERFGMTLAKEHTFARDGRVESILTFSNPSNTDGVVLPLSIHMSRPEDGYSLDFQFRSWRLNPDLPETTFEIEPPPGAERVQLKEKKDSR